MKKGVKVWGLILVLMLAGSVFSWAAEATVAADNDNWESVAQGNIGGSSFNATVSVTRDLPDDPVYPEDEINVTLTQSGFLSIICEDGGIGWVKEQLPEGFTFRGLASGSSGEIRDYDGTTNTLTIDFPCATTVTYIVETGTAEQIETTVFSGTWSTSDSSLNRISGDVEGDTTLTLGTEPTPTPTPIFDTRSGTYPSISGIHNGTITPSRNLSVSKLFTYPCPGTGGHTEYAKIWNSSWDEAEARWNGYVGDWHNLSFNNTFVLYQNETYNYTIRTGSYPQIIHEQTKDVEGGTITCTSFVDANRKEYNDRIPAIRLWG